MKLLLGGGNTPKEGFTNVDILPLPTVDVVADITKGLPFPDNSVEMVIADYLLHLLPEPAFVMEEIYRVCKNGATVIMKNPYYMSEAAFKDPYNKRFFTETSFDYYDRLHIKNGKLPDYKLKCNFKTEKITFNYYRRGTRYVPFISIIRRHIWNLVKNMVVELRVEK
jgi:ubiquinone/menaquinone biosynthesis C-methylase UbiE